MRARHRFRPLTPQAEMETTAEHGRTLRRLGAFTLAAVLIAALAAHVLPKAVAQARLDASQHREGAR